MIVRAIALSRRRMTTLVTTQTLPPDAIVISITGSAPHIFPAETERVQCYRFRDNGAGRYGCMTPEDAARMGAFLQQWHQRAERVALYVNCRGGKHRSGAVVAMVRDACALDPEVVARENPRMDPNPHVHRLLRNWFEENA